MSTEQVMAYEDLLNLVESGKEIAACVDLGSLLQNILERACRLTESDGASVLLEDERTGNLYFAAAVGPGAEGILATYGVKSEKRIPLKSKAGVVFLSGQSLVEESVAQDKEHFKDVDKQTGDTTRNMVCSALNVNTAGVPHRLGVLQIINKRVGPYTERDRVLLEHFGAQAAIAIRNSQLFGSLAAHMGLYTDRNLSEIVEELKRQPRSELLTLMFADMRGFTRLCQTIRSDIQICEVLSEFMAMLGDEVLAHGGTVNKRLGDGILALFGQPESARRAVECAFAMEDRFEKLRALWSLSVPENIDFLDIGIGIVTAPVMLGAIGRGDMRDFTVIGTPVILAAALEKEARHGKRILSDKPTYFAVKGLVEEQAKPLEFPLHKPDQPTITSYDVYELSRRKPAAAAGAASSVRAFLCHASEDQVLVAELYEKLRRDGINPWLDKKDIEAGQEWAVVIPDAVRACDVVLVCISSRSTSKEGYIQKEIKCVLDVADEKPEGTVYVIPVRLEPCPIPRRLSRWQWVDLFEAEGYAKLMRSLGARTSGPRTASQG